MFNNNSQGISIYLSIMVMTILLAIGLGISSILISQLNTIKSQGDSVIAFYAANTGIERELLDQNPIGTSYSDYLDLNNNGFQDSDDSSYSISIVSPGASGCPASVANYCIRSVGSFRDSRRALQAAI